MSKKYIVFGAGGSIGKAIIETLHSVGHQVVACLKSINNGGPDSLAAEFRKSGMKVIVMDDVNSSSQWLESIASSDDEPFDGVIYSIGHCPPGGASKALKQPLSSLDTTMYAHEFARHQFGPIMVYQAFCKHINREGCFLFLSSAITRLNREQIPPWMFVRYHQSVIAAQDLLIEGMREDPVTINRELKVHRIAPAAVETDFHTESEGPHPPTLIPVASVVDEVVTGLESSSNYDFEIIPKQ